MKKMIPHVFSLVRGKWSLILVQIILPEKTRAREHTNLIQRKTKWTSEMSRPEIQNCETQWTWFPEVISFEMFVTINKCSHTVHLGEPSCTPCVFAILMIEGTCENDQKANTRMDQTWPKGDCEIRLINKQVRNLPCIAVCNRNSKGLFAALTQPSMSHLKFGATFLKCSCALQRLEIDKFVTGDSRSEHSDYLPSSRKKRCR